MDSILWFASTNKGKIADLEMALKNKFTIKTPYNLDVSFDVVEDETTFEGNSSKKAHELFEIVKEPTLADDSGIMIDGLDGFPGVNSNRWYDGQAINWNEVNQLLLKKMKTANLDTLDKRTAKFVTVLTYWDGKNEKQFKSVVDGTISFELKGENGFGYSQVFIPSGYDLTHAQLSDEKRRKISSRAYALADFKKWIERGN